jgi:hypothetical protein
MSTSDPGDLLKTAFQSLPLAEVLQKPPGVLLGVSDEAQTALAALGIGSVFDLALARVFEAADQLNDAAENPANPLNRFGAPVKDMVRSGLPGSLKISDFRFQPVDILSGIADPAALKTALGVLTVRDLAVYPPYRAAKDILNQVFFPDRLLGFDPEAPADLVPKSGEFPTERVQYTVLLLDEIRRPEGAPPLIDLAAAAFAPIDVTAVASPSFGFTTLGLGALLTLNQSWFMQGVTLGHLLHSMALAPGESTRIAVVDWSRKSSAGQTEQISESEALSQDTSRNRSISEVTEAVAQETQEGFSSTKSKSTTKQAGISGGFISGALGIGGSASIAKTTASAESYSTTSGSRQVGASTLQQASDSTHQNAHATRTRRASVVREVSQSEHESVSTRVITNYNHMHAMTVQYYEVLQIYRVETTVTRCDRVVFVPFKLIDFSNVDLLRRFRGALVDAALSSAIGDALLNFDTLELAPERLAVFPHLGGTIADILIKPRVTTRQDQLARRAGDEAGTGTGPVIDGDPDIETPPRPPRPTLPDDVAGTLWEGAASKLSAFFKTATVRRNSQSLFVPSDVRVEEGAVQSSARALKLVFVLRDGTRISDLSASVALAEVDRIAISGSDAAADVAATGVLALSRNGIVFPLELPTVTVTKGATETKLIDIRAAGADVNLIQHLNDNQLHYSQSVLRNLDAAMIAGLLSAYSVTLNGQSVPLVQAAEPRPLRIVGNYLAFKINADPARDVEWRTFMANRGIAIGQAKVDIVPLSSGGIFAEAVLGRFNCAEKLDLTRFWNWQDSPIPIQPSDIAAIQTGTRATTENLTPGALSAPIVNITPPAALPDPTGLAGALTAIQNGNMFRDMSGLSDTIKLAQSAITASAAGATAAGSQATDSLKASLTADVERRKIKADVDKNKVTQAADIEKEKIKASKPLANQNPSVQGSVVNEVDKKNAANATSASKTGGGASGTSGGAAGGGGTSTQSRPASGNAALDSIVGNPETLRAFQGLDPDSPEPPLPATAEGVPLQEWDFYGLAYSLLYQESESGQPEFPTETQVEELVNLRQWVPTNPRDFEPLLLGNRKMPGNSFGDLLFALALLPAGSMKTLNLVAYARTLEELAFSSVDFIFRKSFGITESSILDKQEIDPLSRMQQPELLALFGDAPIATPSGNVKLVDVRRAFAADAEVRVFNLSNPLRPEYLQALANLFQVRVSGFTQKPVRVIAEVIAITEEASERVLSKKVDVGFSTDPIDHPVGAFVHLLQRDHPARAGLYTAFPLRA